MKNRVALVTGASQGIGAACAIELAKAGAQVIAAARSREKLDEVVERIRSGGGRAHAVRLDVSSPESIQSGAARAQEVCGRVDILVNNAGVAHDGLALRMRLEQWQQVLDTNLTGAFLCAQALLRGMMKSRWGRIINISSVVGQSGNAGQSNYVASKAGLIGLTKTLALELASRSITVNAVAPGMIETSMTDALSGDAREKILEGIPLGRMGSPEEVAAAVRFLAGEEASYITGHVLAVNGGLYM